MTALCRKTVYNTWIYVEEIAPEGSTLWVLDVIKSIGILNDFGISEVAEDNGKMVQQ